MTESQLTGKLIKFVRVKRPDAVVFKHSDRTTVGVPDMSITCCGLTRWYEVKVEPNWPPTKIQVATMAKIQRASGGDGHYLRFFKHNGRWRMAVIDVPTLDKFYRGTGDHQTLNDDFANFVEDL